MQQDFLKISDQILKGQYSNIYLLHGEEPFYIEKIMDLIEEKVIPEEEKDFNLVTIYGNETNKEAIITEAQGFPMFGERKLILLRNAATMKDFLELESYFLQPMASTILAIEYKGKTLDKRTKLYKTAQKNSTVFTTQRLKEWELPNWIMDYGKSINLLISKPTAENLAMYLGNDLIKITNELEKVRINDPGIKELTLKLMQEYIGISRDFNIFELTDAFLNRDKEKLANTLNFFAANPKDAPYPLVFAAFYNSISRVLNSYSITAGDFPMEKKYGIYKNHRQFAQRYNIHTIHKLVMIMEEYAHKSVGINHISANNDYLLKEMIGRMNLLLN